MTRPGGLHRLSWTNINFKFEVARMPAGSVGLGDCACGLDCKNLNVIKRIRFGVLPGGVNVAFDSLFLQAAEE